MPSTAFSTMLAATMTARRPKINEQIFTDHPLWKKLYTGGQIREWTEGGEEMEGIISAGYNSTFGARDYKSPITRREVDPLLLAKIDSRELSGAVSWYDHQEESNSSSQTAIVNFTNALLDNGRDSMQNVLALELWESGTGEHLHGFGAILHHHNTYMNINRVTAANAYWRANHTDATHPSITRTFGTGAPSFTCGPYHTQEPLVIRGGTDGGLTKIYDDCCSNGGTDSPDVICMTYDLYDKCRALLEAERMQVQPNKAMADLGWPDNFQFRGAAVVWDRNVTAGDVLFLNTKYLEIMPYKGYRGGPVVTEPLSALAADGVYLNTVYMKWRGNLVCWKPQRFGKLTGKTVA